MAGPSDSDGLVARRRTFGLALSAADLHIVFVSIGYALCSSLLTIINKWAIVEFPYPSVITVLQFLTCAVGVSVLGLFRVLEHDRLQWETVMDFFPAAVVFYLAIFTNTMLLKYSNVETFIVFRSSAPIVVILADYFFRSQPWPSARTFVSLFVILAGAVGYVVTDKQFTLTAYSWALAYLFIICFDMVYIKHVIMNVKLSIWGLVLYNNFLSVLIFPFFWLITGDARDTFLLVEVSDWRFAAVFSVGLSCAVGFAMSFFGFACRKAVSATTFTVLGVTNKLLTIIVNVLVWDRHATPIGIFSLLITIVGGVMYQQSVTKPSTPPQPAPLPAAQGPDESTPLKQAEEAGPSSGGPSNLGKQSVA